MRKVLFSLLAYLLPLCCWADSDLQGVTISGNGWVGLDLGTPHIISQIRYMPMGDGNSVLLGVFEGANRADFMDALPLSIISEPALANQTNTISISCSRGFRYVRYVLPDGQSKGLKTCYLVGTAGAGDNSNLCQLTNLPVVTIHTRDNVVPQDKVTEIDAYISIVSDDGHTLLADTATIRERGNYSRNFPKKPYRIKFASKHNVLHSPSKAKKWTLINNYGDKTLMRNQLAFELSRRLQMPYTPFCAYVDVLLNGEYRGCYQLCDQLEVHKGRVTATDFFIEADAYAQDEECYFYSDRSTPVTIKTPKADTITTDQKNHVISCYNNMESDWKRYLDLNTFLRHFLVGELSGNTDTYWSTYFYKQSANDTIYVGPVWDFDIAFENDNRTYPINNKSDYVYRTCGSTVGYLKELVDKIVVRDAGAKQQLYAIWDQARRAGITEESLCAYVDEQAALLDRAQRLNFMRWPIMNEYVHQNPRVWGSYEAEVNNVKNFLSKRLTWMDKKLGYTLPIDQLPIDEQAVKVLHNGQILIYRNGMIYTVDGRMVNRE